MACIDIIVTKFNVVRVLLRVILRGFTLMLPRKALVVSNPIKACKPITPFCGQLHIVDIILQI